MSSSLVGVDGVGIGVDALGIRCGPLHGNFESNGALSVLGLKGDDVRVDNLGLLGVIEIFDVINEPLLILIGVFTTTC